MSNDTNTIRVWDPLVRIGHWTLVAAFFTAYFTEDDFLTQHVWAGYVLATVVAVRLVWGFVGSKHARFSDFLRSPVTTLRYLRDIARNRAQRFIGHNPAGGAMIVALLISLTVTTVSGLELYAIEENAGPFAAITAQGTPVPALPSLIATADALDDDGDAGHEAREELWEEIHEVSANLTLLLVLLHVAGVIAASYAHRENLIKAMITGRKRRDGG